VGRRKVTYASSGFPKDQLLTYYYEWGTVFTALKVYQHLLEYEVRSTYSIFHWICCRYCRKSEQCPKIVHLETEIDSVQEISGMLEDLLAV